MGQDYVLVLAPEARFTALGGWERFPGDLPSWPAPRVVEALCACPGIQHDGLTFWTDDHEEFELDPENIQSIFFTTHGDAGKDILRISRQIAEASGPLLW